MRSRVMQGNQAGPRPMPARAAGLSLVLGLALMLAPAAGRAADIDLVDALRAAVAHDRGLAVSRAGQAAAQSQREVAQALWRPTVSLSATAGIAHDQTRMDGASFSAPGFGQSSGVSFGTSVDHGNALRTAIVARQPLLGGERDVDRRRLLLGADAGDLEWQAAQSDLVLRVADAYFGLALAQEKLAVVTRQLASVARAADEARERYRVGSSPVTDTHEAQAAQAGLAAQQVAAELDAGIKRQVLIDSTGLADPQVRLPATVGQSDIAPLQTWLDAAVTGNRQLLQQQQALAIAQQEQRRYGKLAATTVDLVAMAGRDRLSGNGDFGLASNSHTQALLGLQVNIPLYTGGMRDAREQQALREVDKAQAQLELLRQTVAQQVRATWMGERAERARVAALEQALKASSERLAATRLGREVGDRTTLDLLNAENDLAAHQLSLGQARVALAVNQLRLAALAGQLDDTVLAAVNRQLAR